MLLYFVSTEVRLWTGIVYIFLILICFISFRITKGFMVGYVKSKINGIFKLLMLIVHGLGSLILAFILPNNYLNKLDFFNALYEQNGLWIPASIIVILFMLMLLIGSFFTFLTNRKSEI